MIYTQKNRKKHEFYAKLCEKFHSRYEYTLLYLLLYKEDFLRSINQTTLIFQN